jgi:hypothetical protein
VNPTWTDAQNWLDILDHVWIGLVVIGAAVIPSLFAARNGRNIRRVSEQVSGVTAQVVNGHADAPPLRVDLDRAITAIEQLGRDVHGLRTDLAAEEDRRRQQIAEVRDDVERYLARFKKL